MSNNIKIDTLHKMVDDIQKELERVEKKQSNPLPYTAPDGGRHTSEVDYLKGVIIDIRASLAGKQDLIDNYLEEIKAIPDEELFEDTELEITAEKIKWPLRSVEKKIINGWLTCDIVLCRPEKELVEVIMRISS